MDNEQAAFGVVPVENSLTGSIHENYDLLLEYELKIVGELTLRIKHNLMGQPDASIEGFGKNLLPSSGLSAVQGISGK